MSAITGITDIKRRYLQGKGIFRPFISGTVGSLTSANSTSGFFTNNMNINSVGASPPGTLVGFQNPNTSDELRMMNFTLAPPGAKGGWFGWFYRIGTADLTATTGNRFTHDGTFTRLTRTRGGKTAQNISLMPLIYVTAAASTTQLTYTVGYTDQDGNSISGTITNKFPAATTNAQSLYNIMLEDGDSGILDFTTITVSVATTGATASIFGFEPLSFFSGYINYITSFNDNIYGGTSMLNTQPATANSGSLTQQFLGFLCVNNQGSMSSPGYVLGYDNT